jgi:hypothetical protein
MEGATAKEILIYSTTILIATGFLFLSWMLIWFICLLLPSASLYLNGQRSCSSAKGLLKAQLYAAKNFCSILLYCQPSG